MSRSEPLPSIWFSEIERLAAYAIFLDHMLTSAGKEDLAFEIEEPEYGGYRLVFAEPIRAGLHEAICKTLEKQRTPNAKALLSRLRAPK